jgi:single-strand DNA-binding protein
MDNSVSLTGNLTRDPELRFTNGGMATASFGMAINSRRKNQATGEWEDSDPQFFDVSCFGTLAENVSECLQRGQRVVVAGKMSYRSWESNDGEKRSKVEVVADSCGPDLRWATAVVTRTEKS